MNLLIIPHAEAGRGRWKNPTTPHRVLRETLRYRGSISRFLKSFWKTRWCFFRVVFQSPVLLLLQRLFGFFCCTVEKNWGEGSQDPILRGRKLQRGWQLFICYSEFKRSTSLTPEISVNQLVELHFRGWNSDQFSQNSHATLQKWRLASDDFSFEGLVFQVVFVSSSFFQNGGRTFHRKKRRPKLFFAAKPGSFCFSQESLKSLTLGRECNDLEEMLRCRSRGIGDVEWLFPLAKES